MNYPPKGARFVDVSFEIIKAPGRSRVTCRHCEWSRPAWWTTRGGKRVTGWDALRRHMVDEHDREWAALQQQLADAGYDDPPEC